MCQILLVLGTSYGVNLMDTNNCPKCGAHNTARSTECYNCGADISMFGQLKRLLKIVAIFAVIGILAKIFGGNG